MRTALEALYNDARQLHYAERKLNLKTHNGGRMSATVNLSAKGTFCARLKVQQPKQSQACSRGTKNTIPY